MERVLALLKTRLSLQIAIVLIPFLALVGMVAHYGVNVPVTDQYAMIPLFQKVDAGTLSFGDLWAQHNEHRIFFPRTVLLVLALLTNWSIQAEVIAMLIAAAIGFIALFLILRRLPLPEPVRLLLMAVASLWFFSPVQYENWLWGWQLEWYMCTAAIMWTLYFLYRTKPEDRLSKTLIGAAITAFVATFCLGSGSILWIAGAVVLVLQASKKKQYLFWAGASVASIALYYIGYTSPHNHPSFTTFIEKPFEFARVYLAYLGRPASAEAVGAILFGATLLILACIACYILYRNRAMLKEHAVMVGLVLYVLMTGAATTISRLDYGIIGGLSSRYTAFSVLFVIGVTALVLAIVSKRGLLLDKKISARAIAIVMGLLMLPWIAGSYYNGVLGLRGRSAQFKEIRRCSLEASPTEACLYEIFFPSTVEAKKMLDYLKTKHWGGY